MNLPPGSASSASREATIRTGVVTGLFDTLITTAAMIAARSSVLLADFLKTSLELAAVTLAWLAIRRINRGGHQRYDYGIGKMENLVSLAVGTLMTLCLLIILFNSIHNLRRPSHIGGIGVWISLAAQAVYGVINGALSARGFRAAREQNSPLLASQSRLLLTRAIANGFIFCSLILSLSLRRYEWSVYIDPVASLVIGLSILLAAMGIFSSSVYDLLDRTLEESDQMLILRELVRHFNDYEELHGIRSRRSGSDAFIDILLEFDPEKKVGEVQAIVDHLKQSIETQIPGSRVTIGLATAAPAP